MYHIVFFAGHSTSQSLQSVMNKCRIFISLAAIVLWLIICDISSAKGKGDEEVISSQRKKRQEGEPPTDVRHFVRDDPETVYRSYQSTIYCKASMKIQYPKNISELLEVVKKGIRKGLTVKAIGNSGSITDAICTEGIPISLIHFNHSKVNDDGTATFGAGIEIIPALKFLEERNKTLIHLPAYGGLTLGGALGGGSHGSSLLHPTTIADQVVRLKVIDGTGALREITDAEDVNAFRVHLGLLGIVVEVTLAVVPLFKMTVHNKLEPESILLDGTASKWAKSHDWFEMWWFPSKANVVVSKGTYLNGTSAKGNATTEFLPNLSSLLISGAREAYETLQHTQNTKGLYAIQNFTELSLHGEVIGKPPLYSEDGISMKNPATGIAWHLMINKCTDLCPWNNGENSSILPEESSAGVHFSKLHEAVKTIKEIIREVPVAFPLVGVFIRFSKASPSLMGVSSGRPSVSLEWATPMRSNPYDEARQGIGAYQAILQAMYHKLDGRPHWGKNGLYYFSQKILKKTYAENWSKFKEILSKYDPNGLFMNKFGRRIFYGSDEMDMDPKVHSCALQDYCICSKAEDCGNLQTCGKVDEFSVCKDLHLSDVILKFADFNFDVSNWTSILNYIGTLLQ